MADKQAAKSFVKGLDEMWQHLNRLLHGFPDVETGNDAEDAGDDEEDAKCRKIIVCVCSASGSCGLQDCSAS